MVDSPNGEILIASNRAPAREMIGRVSYNYSYNTIYTPQTVDHSKTDYAFWDQLSYGKKADYSIGGLFAKPIARILASWTLGKGLTAEVKESTATEELLAEFLEEHLITVIEATEDHYRLGDAYLVPNPDGSVVRVSPNQVKLITEPEGSDNVVGYEITTQLLTQKICDRWYADRREVTIIDAKTEGTPTPTVYPNLIGMIPVVHFANERGANELHGRPYYEALLNDFSRYNRTINKALDGTDIMGNPIPTVEGAKDPDETLRLLSGGRTKQYTDADGNTRTQYVVDFANLPVIVVGEGASVKFAAPNNGFTSDASKMLELLFLIMLQHTGIPEWVWGGAIASSKASVDAQMPAFESLINYLRMKLKKPILQLFKVWLAYKALYTPSVVPTAKIDITYGDLLVEDRAQRREDVKFAREDNAITREDGLRILDLVEDPAQSVKDAMAERDVEAELERDQMDIELEKALQTDRDLEEKAAAA